MIWLIISLGSLLRLIGLNQNLWLDEGINIMAAKSYSFFGMVTQYAVADFHPPGWFIILWTWGKLFGYSEIAARIPSVIFGVLTIYITYLIGKKLISRNVGLLAALLLSINPLHIYYSQEARMYSLAALAVGINILIFIKIVKKERINLILLIFSNVLVLLSDYVAYFIFPAEFIFLLLLKEKKFLREWLVAVAVSLVLISWWILVFFRQLDVGAVASANLPTWKFVVGGFDLKALPLTFVKFIIGRISLADKIIYTLILLPICSIFIYILWKGIRSADNFSRKILLAWVIIPPLLATLVSLFVPVYSYFRFLFIVPGFVILIANGILFSKGKLRNTLLTVVFLIQLFCSLVYLFNPGYQRENWRGLVSFLKSVHPQIVLLESSGTFPPFDYYAEGTLNVKGALKDFPARNDRDVADFTGTNIYLVDYLVQISDPDRLVAKKLENLGYKQTDITNFTGVGFVYHYIK